MTLSLAAVVGCGAAPSGAAAPHEAAAPTSQPAVGEAPPPSPPSPTEPTVSHPKLAACDAGDAAACNAVGVDFMQGEGVAQDPEAGRRYLEKSCRGGSAPGCFNFGVALQAIDPPDDKQALSAFEKACVAKHADGCLQAGAMHAKGTGTVANGTKAMAMFEQGCALDQTVSCRNAGIVLAQGKLVPKRPERAAEFFGKGCRLGDEQSCDFEKEVSASSGPGIAGANLTIGEMTADGFTVKNLSCRADGLGFLGGIVLVGALSKRKAQLNRCMPKGGEPVVTWKFSGSRIGEAQASGGTAAENACVARTMKGTVMPGAGECVGTLVLQK